MPLNKTRNKRASGLNPEILLTGIVQHLFDKLTGNAMSPELFRYVRMIDVQHPVFLPVVDHTFFAFYRKEKPVIDFIVINNAFLHK